MSHFNGWPVEPVGRLGPSEAGHRNEPSQTGKPTKRAKPAKPAKPNHENSRYYSVQIRFRKVSRKALDTNSWQTHDSMGI
jgi:hypothetical protein